MKEYAEAAEKQPQSLSFYKAKHAVIKTYFFRSQNHKTSTLSQPQRALNGQKRCHIPLVLLWRKDCFHKDN